MNLQIFSLTTSRPVTQRAEKCEAFETNELGNFVDSEAKYAEYSEF